MRNRFYLLSILSVLVVSLMSGCASWRQSLQSTGNIDVAIDNCITDFCHTSRLRKAGDIFDILYFEESPDLYKIVIMVAHDKVYPVSDKGSDPKDPGIPNRYRICGDKLFYWSIPEDVIPDEMIGILQRYDHIDLDWRATYYDLPPYTIDDGALVIRYYVCRDDLTNYKKWNYRHIVKHRFLRRRNPPTIRCRTER